VDITAFRIPRWLRDLKVIGGRGTYPEPGGAASGQAAFVEAVYWGARAVKG
jgi:hypothetical protein